MLIGVPKEIKNKEFRVGMTPTSVREVVDAGHKVIVETGCGAGIGMDDASYRKAGAKIVKTPEEIFAKAEMIVKVKEPQANERKMLREGQILFTYLHLAPDPAQTKDLVKSKATCIAYETVTSPTGGLPLLAPVAQKLDIDLIWFGLMIGVNLQTSFLTPPFGFALFYLRGVAPESIPTSTIYRGILPWVLLQVIALVILAIWPQIVTWLPRVIYGD